MPTSPEGYQPYQETDFPPLFIRYLANILGGVGIATAFWYYQPNLISGLIAGVFAFVGNIYLHESIHYMIGSKLGYEPVFDLPSTVWIPNVPLSTKEAIINLISPQILTIIYIILLPITIVSAVKFSITVALILNISGGMRDIAWTLRRILWPEDHLVLVDSEGTELVCFRE